MEKLMTLFERFVVAVEKIAGVLTIAATQAQDSVGNVGTQPTAATAAPDTKSKKGKGKKEEPVATPDATLPSIDPTGDDFGGAAEGDDFGGEVEEQAATATRDDALAAIRDLALRKGRDTASALLLQVSGCNKTSDIEALPNAAQIFGALVIAAKKLV